MNIPGCKKKKKKAKHANARSINIYASDLLLCFARLCLVMSPSMFTGIRTKTTARKILSLCCLFFIHLVRSKSVNSSALKWCKPIHSRRCWIFCGIWNFPTFFPKREILAGFPTCGMPKCLYTSTAIDKTLFCRLFTRSAFPAFLYPFFAPFWEKLIWNFGLKVFLLSFLRSSGTTLHAALFAPHKQRNSIKIRENCNLPTALRGEINFTAA